MLSHLPEVDASKGTPNWLQTSGNSDKTKRIKAQAYLDLIKANGGSKTMWNNWCTHVSMLYPHHFPRAWHVSKLHECIWQDQTKGITYDNVSEYLDSIK